MPHLRFFGYDVLLKVRTKYIENFCDSGILLTWLRGQKQVQKQKHPRSAFYCRKSALLYYKLDLEKMPLLSREYTCKAERPGLETHSPHPGMIVSMESTDIKVIQFNIKCKSTLKMFIIPPHNSCFAPVASLPFLSLELISDYTSLRPPDTLLRASFHRTAGTA